MTMFCSQCGAANDEAAQFCVKCGAPLIGPDFALPRQPSALLRTALPASRRHVRRDLPRFARAARPGS